MVSLEWPSTTLLGGGDEIWEQAISKLKKRFTFGHWEVGKGKVQAAAGSMRVGQLGKMRKEQTGDANETEKVAMRPVLGALGFLARESRAHLSGPVSIMQSRFNRAQVSDIQDTNRVVRLAKQGSHRSCTACLQDSCGSSLFYVLRRRQWWEHTC